VWPSGAERLLAARNSLPVTTLAGLVEYAKRNPDKLNYGSAGIGSTLHVMTEMFRREAGFEPEHILFRGSAPAVQAMLGGDVDFLIDTGVIQHVLQGRLRGLAAVGDRRLPRTPDIPTLAEQGYPNVRTSGWQALMGPPDRSRWSRRRNAPPSKSIRAAARAFSARARTSRLWRRPS